MLPSVSEGVDQITPLISNPDMCQLLRWRLPSKEAAAAESQRLKRSEFPDCIHQRIRRNVSDQEHNILTLARSQGLTLARCCIQTRGLSRGIKIVMDSHTILLMLVLNPGL